jgi:large subunit ribosomal protein L1
VAIHGKRYREASTLVEERSYSIDEAVALLKSLPATKFDQTIEVSLRLGIDPRQSDQQLRGSVSLPAGLGKTSRVIVFADEETAAKAKEAGAIEAGLDDLVEKILGGWMDFDVAIAQPRAMSKVGKLGRVLGPQGKMPNPKTGTVTDDVEQAVREFAEGKVEYRNDSGGNIHVPVGKMSFTAEALKENITHFVKHIRRLKPAAAKGMFVRHVVISGSMTPAVEVDVGSV